ncbi:MAG: hypothetical protein ABSA12_03845 [Verrucomicrobiia bacterium]
MDDLKSVPGSLREIRAANRYVLFEQLHMNIERTEWIAKFVSYMREQPGQQIALLLLCQPLQFLRRNGLSCGLGKNPFHKLDGNTICRPGKDGDGIARRIRGIVQNLHGDSGARVSCAEGQSVGKR